MSVAPRPSTGTVLGSLLPLLVYMSLNSASVHLSDAFTSPPYSASTKTRTPSSAEFNMQSIGSRLKPVLQTTHYDDFGDFFFPNGCNNDDNSDANTEGSSFSDSDLYAALRARQALLEKEQQYNKGSSSSSSSFSLSSAKSFDVFEDDKEEKEMIRYNWKEANCVSSVRLQLDDWIRRLAIDLYPLVVCGSARGHLYLADLEAGNGDSSGSSGAGVSTKNGGSPTGRRLGQLDCLKRVHASHLEESIDTESPEQLNEAMEVLFGNYDGGGVLAIAAKKDWIVSSGREGGVHVCSIVGTEEDVYTGSRGGKSKQTRLHLQPLGRLRGLEEEQDDFYGKLESPLKAVPASTYRTPPLITSLSFDNQGTLWAAGYDGILRGYDYEQTDVDDQPLMLRQKHPDHQVDMGSPILSISVNDEIGCGVATTLSQGVVLFCLRDGKILSKWNPFENSKRGEFARSALLVQTDRPQPFDDQTEGRTSNAELIYPDSHWSVIAGGSKGTLYQRPLGIQIRNGLISEKQPLMDMENGFVDRRIRPNHLGQIVAMGSPSTGLLVTASHDGTMRVWDCSLYENDDDDGEEGNSTDISIELVHDDSSIESRTKKPRVLYALSGYKVWLGSIFANDRKLVSDGADNSIIVHSFDEDEDDVLRSREEDDEDMEDFTFD
ncbi:WD repeat-containing protein [Nitzschia inconspicua]|uniref:WD repeat-containing protein n=1 Tax=Nitzschia inconspicua TaxID=303405 RepID=A0A9K3PID6_9STRA|nr:WD repeat-containing protein [Nitzschia inconspicua]